MEDEIAKDDPIIKNLPPEKKEKILIFNWCSLAANEIIDRAVEEGEERRRRRRERKRRRRRAEELKNKLNISNFNFNYKQ